MLSIMLYPHDKLARSTFVLSATTDMLEERAAQLTPRGTVVIHDKPRDVEIRSPKKLIAEALMPRLNFKGEKGKVDPNDPYSGPNIAGQILKRAFALADKGKAQAGIMHVIDEQRDAYRKEGLKGISRENLTNVWDEYRCVAHIAAAFAEVKSQSFRETHIFIRWVGLASDILKEGSVMGNPFGKKILPIEDAWRVLWTPTARGIGLPENFRDSVLMTTRPPWSQWEA